MKQLVQDLSSGETRLITAPAPSGQPGALVIRTRSSLISTGTERMLVEFGRSGLIGKARQQPEKVREVLRKARNDGILDTIEAVRSKLDQPLPLGYCNVGVVEEVGAGVSSFSVGDRVVSNGPHAEVVRVPQNLCAKVPDSVTDEAAAFTVAGAIAMQGVRLVAPTIGENFVVMGLGLLGLLSVQILRANGCRVLGVDPDPRKVEIARALGAEVVDAEAFEAAESVATRFSRGRGVDGVLITASTESNEPVRQAARMCRKRGRIVLVGVTGLDLERSEFFQKELTFQVSCSYGPGRYDPEYETHGHDYPVGYVRWTEQRNFEAFLDLLAEGKVVVEPLISHRFELDDAPEAYDLLATGREPYLGMLLKYDAQAPEVGSTVVRRPTHQRGGTRTRGKMSVGFIGAGNYAGRVLIPAFEQAGASLRTLINSGGVAGSRLAERFSFETHATELDAALDDPALDAVVIATRHDSHADFASRALRAGKHVFCEKPLALSLDELQEVQDAYGSAGGPDGSPVLTVGFNRRFAPLMVALKEALDRDGGPMAIVYTCNAGRIPPDSWVQDPKEGGGRIVGEACHFVDAARYLTGNPLEGWSNETLGDSEGLGDTATLSMAFSGGSIATVHYFANGNKGVPKERIEVYQSGRVFRLDNFRKLKGYGARVSRRSWRLDKGQDQCAQAFVRAVERGGPPPIPVVELFEVSAATIHLAHHGRRE